MELLGVQILVVLFCGKLVPSKRDNENHVCIPSANGSFELDNDMVRRVYYSSLPFWCARARKSLEDCADSLARTTTSIYLPRSQQVHVCLQNVCFQVLQYRTFRVVSPVHSFFDSSTMLPLLVEQR